MAPSHEEAGAPPGFPSLSEEAGRLLRRRGLRLAVAESCTGGLLGARLTAVAGSSDYFLGGVVAYANEVKVGLLGVRPETLERHGAVSASCAAEMAAGIRRRLGAEVGLSVTGVAGPGGGSAEKPVGLVYVGMDGPAGARVRELRLAGSRDEVREGAVRSILEWLCRELALPGPGEPPPPEGSPTP